MDTYRLTYIDAHASIDTYQSKIFDVWIDTLDKNAEKNFEGQGQCQGHGQLQGHATRCLTLKKKNKKKKKLRVLGFDPPTLRFLYSLDGAAVL